MMRRAYLLGLALALFAASPLAAQDTLAVRARALVAAGQFREAADAFQRALLAAPTDLGLLGEAVDALEASGQWREALPLLDRILALRPQHSARLKQRGSFRAWAGRRAEALADLRLAVELRPADPDFLAALAEVLSWEADDRDAAAATFQRGLAQQPDHQRLQLGYAELLSWQGSTRDRADSLYRQVLASDPDNLRARVGLANLMAWGGHPGRALQEYEAILATAPDDVPALRGRGGALNLLGRHREGKAALEEALRLAPTDPSNLQELAASEIGLGNLAAARRALDQIHGMPTLEVRTLRDTTRRALASSVALGLDLASRQRQLDRRGAQLDVALAPSTALRLHLGAGRVHYDDLLGTRRVDGFGAGVGYRSAHLRVSAEGRLRDLAGVETTEWDGAASVGWSPRPSIAFSAGWQRSPVEETRASTFGQAGDIRGPVHAELATGSFELRPLPGWLYLRAGVVSGTYRAQGMRGNDRLTGLAEVGVLVHRYQPWLRIGYATEATRFGFNADTGSGGLAADHGGYFSPRRFFMHQGVVQLAQHLGPRVLLEVDGRLGSQWTRSRPGQSLEDRMAGTLNARITARLTGHLDLGAQYLYVDAFDAFRMHQARVLFKQFF